MPKQMKAVATKRTTSVEIHHAAQPLGGMREAVPLDEGGLTLTAWRNRRPFKIISLINHAAQLSL